MPNENILEVKNVQKSFGKVITLSDGNFELKHGEIHALLGENGAGKSTLAKILAGIYSKDKGKMLENNVFLSLRKKYKEIFYFQKDKECDFIVKDREKVVQAIQVCYEFNDENQDREINGLIEAMTELKLKEGLILTYNQEDDFEIKGKKIIVKPVWKWLSKDGK